jgi:hypothetical protein
MRSYSYASLALCGALLGANVYGYGTVGEQSQGQVYIEGRDYSVTYPQGFPPQVEILQPSVPGTPYWFECYEGDEEAAIGSITAASDLGTVEVKVAGYGGHTYGASDVWKVQIGQTGSGGKVVELNISGNYGDADHGDTLTLTIGGDIVKPVQIGTGGVESFRVAGDIAQPVQIAGGGAENEFIVSGDILPDAPVTVDGSLFQFAAHDIGADVTVAGDVGGLITGTISAHMTITGSVGSSAPTGYNLVGFHELDGTLEIQGDLRGYFFSYDLDGCMYVWGDMVPCGDFDCCMSTDRVWGTVYVGGDLGGTKVFGIGELRPQGEIDVAGSVVGPLNIGFLYGALNVAGGASHDGGILAPVEVAYDVTGRIVDEGNLESSIHTPLSVTGYPDMPPEDGGQIVIAGAVTEDGSIEVGAVTNGRIEVGSLAGSVSVGDLAGVVRVGSPYADQPPMSGSISVGTMTGKIFLDTGFASEAVVQIEEKSDPTEPADVALFVVNADGANPESDDWQEDATVVIGSTPYGEPTPTQNLWWASCVTGDVDGDGVVTGYDIDPFVLMISNPASYCATYPGLCGGLTPSADGSFTYRGDLNCDGAVNGYDIDPFVLKLTSQASYEAAYPPSCDPDDHAECCPGSPMEGMGALGGLLGALGAGEVVEEADSAATAQFIVENVSAELRPALLEIASQLADELPDPDRAALWAEVAAELAAE